MDPAVADAVFGAAWDLVDASGPGGVEPTTSRRELARRAGVSPAGLRHHFDDSGGLGTAMVQRWCERFDLLPVEEVRRMLAGVSELGVPSVVRAAAQANWDLHTLEAEVRYESGYQRTLSVGAAVDPSVEPVRAILGTEYLGSFVPVLARTYELLFERAGLALNQDISYEDLARILACTSEGLLAQWCLDPEAIRASLTADLTVAMAAVMTVRADSGAPVDDLAARFPAGVPFDPAEARAHRLETARAAADAGMFATSTPTTFTVVGEAIGADVLTLRQLFGSIDHLVACAFARHLPDLRTASASASPTDATATTLSALAHAAAFDPIVAGALLRVRLAGSPPPTLADEVAIDAVVADADADHGANRRSAAITGVVDATLALALGGHSDLDGMARRLATALER